MEKQDREAAGAPAPGNARSAPDLVATTLLSALPGGGRTPPQPRSTAQILALQGVAGNRAVARLVAGRPTRSAPRLLVQRERGSSDRQVGYEDGVAGRPQIGAPRIGETLDDYNEGWLQGTHDAEAKQASVMPPPSDQGPTTSDQAPPAPSATPAPAPAPSPAPVAQPTPLTLTDRLMRSIKATGNHLSPELFEQIKQLLSPESLAVMATFVASQFMGLGEAADLAGLAMLAAKIGSDAVTVARDIKDFVVITMTAQNDDDFDRAGQKLAHGLMLAGVDTLLALLAAKGEGESKGDGGGEEGGGTGGKDEGSGGGGKDEGGGGGKDEGGGKGPDETKQPDPSKKSDDTSPADDAAKQAARQKRLADLANDPDKGGVTPGSTAEAVDALKLEESGDVPAPVRRANGKVNPRENGADFVDGQNGLWDHKFAKSGRGFDPARFLDKIQQNDIANGEKIMLNHEGLTDGDRAALLKEIDVRGLRDWFKGIPPL